MKTKYHCVKAGGYITLDGGFCSNTDCLAVDCWFGSGYQGSTRERESGCLIFCPVNFEAAERRLDGLEPCDQHDGCRNCPAHPNGSTPTAPGIVNQS